MYPIKPGREDALMHARAAYHAAKETEEYKWFLWRDARQRFSDFSEDAYKALCDATDACARAYIAYSKLL